MRGEEEGITGREETSWLWMDGCHEESMPAVKMRRSWVPGELRL